MLGEGWLRGFALCVLEELAANLRGNWSFARALPQNPSDVPSTAARSANPRVGALRPMRPRLPRSVRPGDGRWRPQGALLGHAPARYAGAVSRAGRREVVEVARPA